MKQCPKCGLTYADDMNFCLEDGATLLSQTVADEKIEAQTVLSEQPKVEPIIVSDARDINSNFNLQNQPQTKPKSNSFIYAVGALILLIAGLAIGATTVFLMNRKSNAPSNDNSIIASSNSSNRNANQTIAAINNSATNNNSSNPNSKKASANSVNVNVNANTNTNAKPSPTTTPKPSPSVKPSPTPTPITSKSACFLDDKGAGGGEVNVRQNCDVADCENDSSTVAGTYPNNTEIKLLGAGAQTANYRWLKIRLVKQNKVAWVSTTKYFCDDE